MILEDWRTTMERLRTVDVEAFSRVVAAASAFLAIHEYPEEDAEAFDARVAAIRCRGGAA